MRRLIIFCLVVLSACSKERIDSSEGVEVQCSFILTASGFSSVITKANVAVLENDVKNIWALQFAGTGGDALLIKKQYIDNIADYSQLSIPLMEGVSQRVVFIANSFDQNLFSSALINTYTYSDFIAQSVTVSDESSIVKGGGDPAYLMMYGVYIGDIPNESATLYLSRLCAKVTYSYTSETVSEYPGESRFRIKSVQLKGVAAEHILISNPSNTTLSDPSALIDYPLINGTGDFSGSVVFYLPENIAGIVSSVISQQYKAFYAPAKATWIEVCGEGIDADGLVREYVTFKFYLGNNNTTDYNINTNTHYTVSSRFKGVNIADTRVEVERVSDIVDWDPQTW